MRFHQYGEALPYAYKYRLDLQLAFPKKTATVDKALRGVEEVIDRLERFENRWKRWGRTAWGLLVGEHDGGAVATSSDSSPGNDEEESSSTGSEKDLRLYEWKLEDINVPPRLLAADSQRSAHDVRTATERHLDLVVHSLKTARALCRAEGPTRASPPPVAPI